MEPSIAGHRKSSDRLSQELHAVKLFRSKISLRLVAKLLSLDLRRNDGVVDHVWSIDGVDGRHPETH